MESKPNCLFYGRFMYVSAVAANLSRGLPFILLAQDGNACGLRTDAHSPCCMEQNREPVEWSKCPYVKAMRMEPVD